VVASPIDKLSEISSIWKRPLDTKLFSLSTLKISPPGLHAIELYYPFSFERKWVAVVSVFQKPFAITKFSINRFLAELILRAWPLWKYQLRKLLVKKFSPYQKNRSNYRESTVFSWKIYVNFNFLLHSYHSVEQTMLIICIVYTYSANPRE